jgi:hypothetical protein
MDQFHAAGNDPVEQFVFLVGVQAFIETAGIDEYIAAYRQVAEYQFLFGGAAGYSAGPVTVAYGTGTQQGREGASNELLQQGIAGRCQGRAAGYGNGLILQDLCAEGQAVGCDMGVIIKKIDDLTPCLVRRSIALPGWRAPFRDQYLELAGWGRNLP